MAQNMNSNNRDTVWRKLKVESQIESSQHSLDRLFAQNFSLPQSCCGLVHFSSFASVFFILQLLLLKLVDMDIKFSGNSSFLCGENMSLSRSGLPGRRSNSIARRRCRSREDRKESLKAWVFEKHKQWSRNADAEILRYHGTPNCHVMFMPKTT